MGLLDNDLSLLGLNILANNNNNYGRLGPALTGGMTGYLNSKAAMRQQALKEQQAEQARALQAQQAAMQKAKYQQQLEQYRQKKNAIAALPAGIRPYVQAGAMDAYNAIHPKPSAPSAFDRKLWLLRNHPQEFEKMYGKGGMRVSVGPDGQMVFEQGSLTPTTKAFATNTGKADAKAIETAREQALQGDRYMTLLDSFERRLNEGYKPGPTAPITGTISRWSTLAGGEGKEGRQYEDLNAISKELGIEMLKNVGGNDTERELAVAIETAPGPEKLNSIDIIKRKRAALTVLNERPDYMANWVRKYGSLVNPNEQGIGFSQAWRKYQVNKFHKLVGGKQDAVNDTQAPTDNLDIKSAAEAELRRRGLK